MLTLLGVAVIVLGFALRFNPLLVVIAAGLTSGLAAGLTPVEVLAAFGKAFNTNRYVSVAWLVLPAIGVLERAGLREQARRTIQGLRAATAGRILLAYLALRQIAAALGLTQVAGQAQTVRPLLAPMAEAAAGVAAVNQLAAILQMKINAFTADHGGRRAVAGIQAGAQQSAHGRCSFFRPPCQIRRRRTFRR